MLVIINHLLPVFSLWRKEESSVFPHSSFSPPIDIIKDGYCTVTCWFVKSCSEALRWHFQCCHLSVLKLDVTNEAWIWLWKHTLMDTSWIMFFSASYNDQKFQNWFNVGVSVTWNEYFSILLTSVGSKGFLSLSGHFKNAKLRQFSMLSE